MASKWKETLDGFGIMKSTVVTSAINLFMTALTDMGVAEKIAKTMYEVENPEGWSGVNALDKAIWLKRAQTAMLGIVGVLKTS